MSIYVVGGKTLGNKVKLGYTFDPPSRIKNMQTYHPEPVRYSRIYVFTSSNVTLPRLERHIHDTLEPYRYISSSFCTHEKKPHEFYPVSIVPLLDIFMTYLQTTGTIDFLRFDTIETYLEADIPYDDELIEILKGRSKN